MESTNLIILMIASGIIGAFVGSFIATRGLKAKGRKQLEEELSKTNNQLKQYQNQVSEHFLQTAYLVNNLTRDYKALHDHLSLSAAHLSNLDMHTDQIGNEPSAPAFSNQSARFNPPLDYAQKRGQVGTLSENYGLDEENKKPPSPDGLSEVD